MKFKYSEIGNNTKENRDHLEKLGYKQDLYSDSCPYIVAFESKYPVYYGCIKSQNGFSLSTERDIDCTHSDKLFRAVTAIREDSDITIEELQEKFK